MNSSVRPAALFVALSLLAGVGKAQTDENEPSRKNKTIIIHPKEDSKQKYTIVIDGSNITVNGKPVDEFNGSGIDIIREDAPRTVQGLTMSPFRGGWNMVHDGNAPPVNKALLGVATDKADKGVEVKEVSKESAAEKAGLKQGDIISKVNDTKIETPADLYKAVSQFKPEDKITITYLRDGKEQTATAVLKKNTAAPPMLRNRFEIDGKELELPDLGQGLRGFRMERPDRPATPRFGIQIQDMENTNGAKVTDVTEESVAFKAGLKKDDIITALNGKAVNSVAEVKRELAASGNSEVKVSYLRNNKKQETTLKSPKRLEEASL